jgi:hypothetical protein
MLPSVSLYCPLNWRLVVTLSLEARTSTRPLASGDVSMFQAFVFLIPQLALGVWLLSQLNDYRFAVTFSPSHHHSSEIALQFTSWTLFLGLGRAVSGYEAGNELAPSCPG